MNPEGVKLVIELQRISKMVMEANRLIPCKNCGSQSRDRQWKFGYCSKKCLVESGTEPDPEIKRSKRRKSWEKQ